MVMMMILLLFVGDEEYDKEEEKLDDDLIDKSKSRITSVLKLFSSSSTIKSFLVQDFFDRAKESITKFKNLKRSE